MAPSIVPSSSYKLLSSQHAASLAMLQDEYNSPAEGYFYGRWGCPTSHLAAQIVADLEQAEGALIFASGMAAIACTFFTVLSAGEHVVVQSSIYGGTHELIEHYTTRYGFEYTYADGSNAQNFIDAINPNTKLVYTESPANPTMQLTDLYTLGQYKLKHRPDIRIACDSTLSAPYHVAVLTIPGVDIAIQSATKYLSGHSDLIAGSIAANDKALLHKLSHMRKIFGGSTSAFDAFLLIRGMKTLAVRMERHSSNALAIAEYLGQHRLIKAVYYPGLPSHPQHELAKKMMHHGFSGMLSFELIGDDDTALQGVTIFIESLKLITLAVSLGSVESLIVAPAATTHRMVSKEQRMKSGISDSLVRMSVGIEDVNDLIDDLEQALDAADQKVYQQQQQQ
jgi:cystathionine beta-lyase/cystathionine gamma-synthase